MIAYLAKDQNWAKLTPGLGIITTFLLFKYTTWHESIFWALINIPLYLFHQSEEHYIPGGFKQYINRVINKLPPGEEMLTDIKVFWINILFVWLAFTLFGALAFLNIGFGLLIIIFSVMNCFTHIVAAMKHHEWNPGLVMASLQFIISIYAAYFISSNGQLTHLYLWWFGIILFSVVAHIALFKLAMTKKSFKQDIPPFS